MTARAHVEADFMRQGVAIHLGRSHVPGRIEVAQPAELVIRRLEEPEVVAVNEPWIRLPEDLARALLDALAAHFGGHTDTRTLRADYDHERRRVDRLIDHMIGASDTQRRTSG